MASETTTPSTKPSLRTDRVRLAVLMAPKPGLSFEEFDRYWLDVHGNVFSSIAIAKRNLLKYEQVSSMKTCPPTYSSVVPYHGSSISIPSMKRSSLHRHWPSRSHHSAGSLSLKRRRWTRSSRSSRMRSISGSSSPTSSISSITRTHRYLRAPLRASSTCDHRVMTSCHSAGSQDTVFEAFPFVTCRIITCRTMYRDSRNYIYCRLTVIIEHAEDVLLW